jgi:hypothetical protein
MESASGRVTTGARPHMIMVMKTMIIKMNAPEDGFGTAGKRMKCWSTFVTPGAPRMHDDASVYLGTNEESKGLGHTSAVHVHPSGT